MTGRVLDGRYRVGARIARGGMATVYEAHDLRLDRGCAVKVMHADLGEDADFRRRFVREAHAVARLSHPNVVSVSDQGDDGGVLFLVMEHVRGRTLRDLIRTEAPMRPERALALLEPVLSALAVAHANGLVHRDVKPENVLIADDGAVKVADFGLARAFDASTSQTATRGVLIGTVSYLAPELIVDGTADPRVDVYAAGVLLFELLTGRKPHEGEGAIQIAFKHVNEDVAPPSSLAPDPLPSYVDALVTRATARDHDQRPADAKVFLHQLRRVTATLRAGILDDPELTADLLPTAPVLLEGADTATAHARREATADLGLVDEDARDARHDEDSEHSEESAADDAAARFPMPDTEETTTVFSAAGLARAGAAGAAGATGAAAARAGSAPSRTAAASQTRRPTVTARRGAPSERSGDTGGSRDTGGTGRAGTAVRTREPEAPRGRAGRAGLPGQPGARRPGEPGPPDTVAPAPPRRRSRRRRPRRGVVLLVLVALLAVLAGYGGWWLAVGRYTAMPGIENLTVADAQDRLESAGLDLDVTDRVFSETVPAGSVVTTDPEAGSRIVEGGTVEVAVSKGRERYAVPAMAGTPLEEVESILAERNLVMGEPREAWSETVPEGQVVSVDPRVGTELRRESVVTPTISKGPQPIRIPDFAGRSAEQAQARLDELGFTLDVTEENSDSVDKGVVISQSPDDGRGFRDDVIELVVSKGPVMVQVPGLTGMSVEQATSALAAVGLTIAVEKTSLYIGLDTVVQQDPDEGLSLPKGSAVTVGTV